METNEELPVVMTPGGCGAQIDIMTYLRWYLEKLEPAPSNDTLIDLKFVFDGARMTSRGNKVQEVGTFDLLFTGQSLSTIRSPTNSHQWAIIFSEETRENLRRELKDGLK